MGQFSGLGGVLISGAALATGIVLPRMNVAALIPVPAPFPAILCQRRMSLYL
ncbi:hypothetical protein VSX61_21360 [Brenneria populi subsp. brevivirga]|uniref:hypothetical protein n=1 Tax=Brenneria populi TaxID=1505588 RepID=UPI002E19961B|nr:hypothetical protein [Brenneria populi subsp. brevivirga]